MAEYNLKILKKERLTDRIVSLWLDADAIAEEIRPGQFFQVLCGGSTYLRRPISVCDVVRNENGKRQLRLVLEEKGEGTRLLGEKNPGETLNVLGPLGNGFDTAIDGEAVLIGGGIGVCPLLYLTRVLKSRGVTVRAFLGFRSEPYRILCEDYEELGADVVVSTDDGSYGESGYALSAYEKYAGENPAMLYTCGPQPMMNAVVRYADSEGILYQESREERMGCGIGACLVCACKLADGSMGHVCKDGPVFGTGIVKAGGKVAFHE